MGAGNWILGSLKGVVRFTGSPRIGSSITRFPFKDVFLGLELFRGLLNPLLVVSASNSFFIVDIFLPGFFPLGGYEFPRISLGF